MTTSVAFAILIVRCPGHMQPHMFEVPMHIRPNRALYSCFPLLFRSDVQLAGGSCVFFIPKVGMWPHLALEIKTTQANLSDLKVAKKRNQDLEDFCHSECVQEHALLTGTIFKVCSWERTWILQDFLIFPFEDVGFDFCSFCWSFGVRSCVMSVMVLAGPSRRSETGISVTFLLK